MLTAPKVYNIQILDNEIPKPIAVLVVSSTLNWIPWYLMAMELISS